MPPQKVPCWYKTGSLPTLTILWFCHDCIKPSLFTLCTLLPKSRISSSFFFSTCFCPCDLCPFICTIYLPMKTCSPTPSVEVIQHCLSTLPGQEEQNHPLWSSWWREGSPFSWVAILRLIKAFPTEEQTLSKSCAESICDSGWCDIKSLSTWGWYTETESGIFPQEHRENIQIPENE